METQEAIDYLGQTVQKCFEEGNPVLLHDVSIRPSLLVQSINPLVYERLGRFKRRGPHLVGTFAVETLIWDTHQDQTVKPYLVLPVGATRYGARCTSPDILTGIASAAGLEQTWSF